MTSGCAAKREKTTEPSTEANRTSLTPKLMAVLANMSKEKARAGRILYGQSVLSSSPRTEYHQKDPSASPSSPRDTKKKPQQAHVQGTSTSPKRNKTLDILDPQRCILCEIHIHRRRHHPVIPSILPIAPIEPRSPSHIIDHPSKESNLPPLLCPRSVHRRARHFSRQSFLAFVPEMGLGAQRMHAALPRSLFSLAVAIRG